MDKKTNSGFLIFLIVLGVFFGCSQINKESDNSSEKKSKSSTPIPAKLLHPADLKYLGAFRVPHNENLLKSWHWGGYGLTYNPGGDPESIDNFSGSLFGTGHAWQHEVAEISIPEPVISSGKNVNDLNTAKTLQAFQDIYKVGDWELPRVGICYLAKQGSQSSDKLYLCWGGHLVEGGHLTHAWCETNLKDPKRKGNWYLDVEHQEYNTNEYIFALPENWADKYTQGKYLLTGRFRDGGWSGQGPSLYAIGPWQDGNPPNKGKALSNIRLLQYTSSENFSDSPHIMTNYHHSDEWNDGLWLTTSEKAAVIFVGTKGEGDCWYGFSNGVVWEDPYPQIPAFPHNDRGWWSTELKAKIIFYDPADLAAVAEGKKQAYEPQPYAVLDLSGQLFNGNYQIYNIDGRTEKVQRKYRLGACSFDRDNGLLYIFELFADEDQPVIHVWEIVD
jgi:hypothetical protein